MKDTAELIRKKLSDERIDALIRQMMNAPKGVGSVTVHARDTLRGFIAAEIDRLGRKE